MRTACSSRVDEGVQLRKSKAGSYESEGGAPLAAECPSLTAVPQHNGPLVGRLHQKAIERSVQSRTGEP